ncbi:hypothetical protein [Cellulomonas sp. Marseille-Q8402]
MSEHQSDRPEGVLPGGDPDDVSQSSTPGSDGDGPEAGYAAPETSDDASQEDAPADGR